MGYLLLTISSQIPHILAHHETGPIIFETIDELKEFIHTLMIGILGIMQPTWSII